MTGANTIYLQCRVSAGLLAWAGGLDPSALEFGPDPAPLVPGQPALGLRQVVAVAQTPSGLELAISLGSVVDFHGDALVNAANVRGLGGGGVDGAVNDAGGPLLHAARSALSMNARRERIPVGTARTTIGGNLAARFVIHATGPAYHWAPPKQRGFGFGKPAAKVASAAVWPADDELRMAYATAVDQARQVPPGGRNPAAGTVDTPSNHKSHRALQANKKEHFCAHSWPKKTTARPLPRR